MDLENLISDILSRPVPAIGYTLSRHLHALYPDRALLEGAVPAFDLQGYAQAGLCTLTARTVPHSHYTVQWDGSEGGQHRQLLNGLFDVAWQGERFQVLVTLWQDVMFPPHHYCIIAETWGAAERFHGAVCAWRTAVPEEYILVFDVGGWVHDQALREAIRNATLDNLVLRGTLKQEILADLESFFASRELYAEYDVPWKRGILFVGPAGNGKTHTVKAMINALGQRCLYVKSFTGHGPDQNGIRLVFQQARTLAPCILVFEDLDSLITAENRSYFLNELDGFAGNDGILTLATTNHPERLDPAILDRPSRFDRKYPFDLPGLTERATYIAHWNDSLRPALRLSAAAVDRTAEATEGFSFAYLKELFLSATMRWIGAPVPGTMDAIMAEQVPLLHDQMASVIELPSDPGYGGQMAGPPQFDGPAFGRGPRRPLGLRQ